MVKTSLSTGLVTSVPSTRSVCSTKVMLAKSGGPHKAARRLCGFCPLWIEGGAPAFLLHLAGLLEGDEDVRDVLDVGKLLDDVLRVDAVGVLVDDLKHLLLS